MEECREDEGVKGSKKFTSSSESSLVEKHERRGATKHRGKREGISMKAQHKRSTLSTCIKAANFTMEKSMAVKKQKALYYK